MELFLNGKKADLGNNILAITRSVLDFDNITLRKIDITNRIILPDTQTNREIFEFGHNLNSNSNSLDKIYNSKIKDQVNLLDGTAFVKEYGKKGYQIQLTDSSKEFFDNLNENINKLNFEQFDFVFNNANYNILKDINQDSIFVWPVVSMHNERITSNTRFISNDDGLKFSRPLIRYKTLINTIFNNQNWNIEYPEIIDKLCISTNHEAFYVTSYQKKLNQTLNISTPVNLSGFEINDFNNNVTLTNTSINIKSIKSFIRLRGEIVCDGDFVIQFKGTDGDSKVKTQDFFITNGQTEVDIETTEFETDTNNNSIEIIISGSGNLTFKNTLLYTKIEEQNLGQIFENNLIGYLVKAHENLPDKTQIQIFKDILFFTNSIIKPDSLNKKINIVSLNKLSKNNSLNWSEKYDEESEEITLKNRSFGKVNNLLYDNDNTIFKSLGKSSFEVNNESLKDSVDYIQFNYSASNDVEINNYQIGDFNIYNDIERQNQINPRILYLYENNNVPFFTLARFLELDFRTLKENYYKNFLESFKRHRIIEGLFDLNKLDVIGFDFMKLIYIDYFKSHFFVFEIENFISGQKTKLKMIKYL